MDLNPLDILYHIINIVFLYILLRFIIYKPVRRFLNERAERIQKQIEDAAAMEKAAAEARAELDGRIANADETVRLMVQEGEKKAAAKADEIIAEAKKQAENILNEAQAQAQDEARRIIETMQDQIADVAVEIAGRILQREVSLEDNRAAVDEFFTLVSADTAARTGRS
jgi:F-type H+-transporting ATPase subunit b